MADWLQARGFTRPREGVYFGRRAQEALLQQAGRADGGATAIQTVLPAITGWWARGDCGGDHSK